MWKLKFIIICAIILNAQCASMYEATLEVIETAYGDNDKVFHFDTLRIKKYNRTAAVIHGIFTVKQELDEDIDIYVAALNFQGGQYKKMIDKTMANFCETVYNFDSKGFYDNYQLHTTHPVKWKTCPYPAGTNEVNNFLLSDYLKYLPPYVPGGEKWKAEVRFLRGEEDLGGYNIYGILRNDLSLLG